MSGSPATVHRNGRAKEPRCDRPIPRSSPHLSFEARRDPLAAYSLLRPGRRNAIRYLGPAFFTKFLYFAGGGDPHHRSLILDSRVASTLRTHGWDSLRAGGNRPAATYSRYTELIARWSSELGCRGDVIEMWLFDSRIAGAGH
ncbi:hypothetical protein [Gordonia sp. (in: high G+C Gram-positive bacteria)]|uniref:8-oxoguanine DNA glycosylase OGG fold protein n=1 Tax=Gordonia sp. (in: high G+C Gram-positive bacteria) TaxID=84139 RepID=UPI003C77B426